MKKQVKDLSYNSLKKLSPMMENEGNKLIPDIIDYIDSKYEIVNNSNKDEIINECMEKFGFESAQTSREKSIISYAILKAIEEVYEDNSQDIFEQETQVNVAHRDSKKTLVFKFKDGTKIEVIDSKGMSKEELLKEAKKVKKQLKDSKKVKDEPNELVEIDQDNELEILEPQIEDEIYEKLTSDRTLGTKLEDDSLYYIPTNTIVYRNFKSHTNSVLSYQQMSVIAANVLRVAEKPYTLENIEWVSAIVQEIAGLYNIVMKFDSREEEEVVTQMSLEAARTRQERLGNN